MHVEILIYKFKPIPSTYDSNLPKPAISHTLSYCLPYQHFPCEQPFLSTAAMIRVSEAIKRDHREIEDCYYNILNATSDDEKTRWQNQFTWELARHSVGEELIVYPAMEKHLTEGKAMADKDRKEHQKVNRHFSCSNSFTDLEVSELRANVSLFILR